MSDRTSGCCPTAVYVPCNSLESTLSFYSFAGCEPRGATTVRSAWISAITLYALLASAVVPLSAQPPAHERDPCGQITGVCQKAGFSKGSAKAGTGLYTDCIAPIMRGTPQPPTAKTPLPQVSADVVAACRQKRPNFGEQKPKTASSNQPSDAH
jgi:hypothetical protein